MDAAAAGGGCSSSTSLYSGFERLPCPKRSRRRLGRINNSVKGKYKAIGSVLPPGSHWICHRGHKRQSKAGYISLAGSRRGQSTPMDAIFRFSMRNIYRSYTNTMKLIYDAITKHSGKMEHGKPSTCPDGSFSIRILGPIHRDKIDKVNGEDTSSGAGSSKEGRKIKSKKKVKGKKVLREKRVENHFVDLVLRHSDLYLLGFRYKGRYYKLRSEGKGKTVDSEGDKDVFHFPFSGSYHELGIDFKHDIPIGIPSFVQMFESLTTVEEKIRAGRLDLIQQAIVTAVIVFCEGLRFPKLQQFIAYSFGEWYRREGSNRFIPKEEADRHLHMWSKYSRMIFGVIDFEPSSIFASLDDLLSFVGVLLLSAVKISIFV
ncbi:hypothetical protein ACP4OV_019998 [Aristida adscensionis]